MKNSIMLVALCIAVMTFTGCLSYTGMTEVNDDLTDEANQTYAAAAAKAFAERMKAPPRPVVIQEAPGVSLFLAPDMSVRHPLLADLNVRKELILAFKSQLRSTVSGIKDFALRDETAAPMVAIMTENDMMAPATDYRMTYNITSIELKENASGSLVTGLAGQALGGVSGRMVAGQKFWDGCAKVEIRLFKPDGKPVFTFVGDGKYTKMVDILSPLDKTILLGAVEVAVKNAMTQYSEKYGPPIFVTETCQNGQFAKLSVGSKFGLQAAQKIQFYRNKIRKGVFGEDEVSRVVVGTGIVGEKNAPVEEDGAWVLVEDFDVEKRTVFRWTSARILPLAK